ncbi:elongation factor P [Candidatus Uhrbacteria bacterium]|nr:elongation factor P [Candidatus Uhrbacteria bacterium]
MMDTSSIKKDLVIMFKDAPHFVVDFQHVNPGKGSAFVRTRLKNVQTGKVFEHTYKSGEAIDVVELQRSPMQYLYKDADNFYFMDNSSFEQVGVPAALVAEKGNYLKEGQEATVLLYEGAPLSIDLPKKLTFKITEAAPGVKGDTASGRVTKEATTETGLKVAVPLFVKEGDAIIINTETGEYVERA